MTAVVEKIDGVDFDADVDLVAVTAMGVSPMLRAYQIADRFRARGVPVVAGGANFTLCPDEAKQHADAVVLGESEELWPAVLEDAKRRELKPFYKSDELPDLAKIRVPRYDLFNRRPEFRGALLTVQASRGCPHRCDYCAIGNLHGGNIRYRPVDDVVRDVKATGARRIFFADDNTTANRKYYLELFEEGLRYAYRKMYGVATVARRLLGAPLFNPMADALATYMNLKYLGLNLWGGHQVFDFG